MLARDVLALADLLDTQHADLERALAASQPMLAGGMFTVSAIPTNYVNDAINRRAQ